MQEHEAVVVMAHSPRSWARVLKQYMIDHGGGRVQASIMAEEDALATPYDVFIADDTTSFLTGRLVAELQRRGISVLGVYDPSEGEGSGKERLVERRVDAVIEADASPEEFLRAVTRLTGETPEEEPARLRAASNTTGPDPFERDGPERDGRVLVVTGASGGVGATETAIALSFALCRRGETTVLVDADDIGPSIAQRLSLGAYPNIRTAVDTVRHQAALLNDSLLQIPSAGLAVLGGLANRRDWFELRPLDVSEVLLELASARDRVVVNVGARVEDLPAMGGPARHGVARAVLALADAIVLVASPSPVGAARVLDWIAESRPLIGGTPLHVAFNASMGGRFVAEELKEELEAVYRPRSVTFLPHDRGLGVSAWQGDPTPRGPFQRAVDSLAEVAAPARVRPRRSGRRRR